MAELLAKGRPVEVVGSSHAAWDRSGYIGKHGVIEEVDEADTWFPYFVAFDDMESIWFGPHDVVGDDDEH